VQIPNPSTRTEQSAANLDSVIKFLSRINTINVLLLQASTKTLSKLFRHSKNYLLVGLAANEFHLHSILSSQTPKISLALLIGAFGLVTAQMFSLPISNLPQKRETGVIILRVLAQIPGAVGKERLQEIRSRYDPQRTFYGHIGQR
jgi:hypothetical protein